MAQAVKEIGFLWAFFVSCLLINADERGKRIFFADQSCDIHTEYKELLALENDGQCHSFDSVIRKLRDLHARSQHFGPHCMHEVIGKMKSYFSLHHNTSGGCKCSGHVTYHPDKYHNGNMTCKNRDHNFDVLYADLFGSGSKTGPCLLHDEVWVRLGSLPIRQPLDCQWEIINRYITILDANGPRCNCTHASVLRTCMKALTISILLHGAQQSHPNAGNCHLETNDHQSPEALVMNMCNVADAPETWTSGQNVMSVCARIPLYTPVATFLNGKYHSQGGHAGIFIGCLPNGFKIIVQECDQNITVMHVTTGNQPDPVNYFIIM